MAATAIGQVTGTLAIVAPLTIPYFALFAGLRAPIRMRRDLSYGVYIYAWPVQQLLAMAGIAALGVAAYAAAAGVLVVGLALLSWTLVEKPALRLRTRAAQTPTPVPSPAVVSA